MSRRFRWTRASYKRAHHLARLMDRFYSLPEKPAILDRYFELWRRYQQFDDPLLRHVRFRLQDKRNDDDGIPF